MQSAGDSAAVRLSPADILEYVIVYLLIGYNFTKRSINAAIMAGNSEKSIQIIFFTASISVMVTSPSLELNPAKPKNITTKAPEMAEPNFCDMVPDEKISPVLDVPFFSVA